MSHRNSESDAYYKICNDIRKIIGTNDKPNPPKLDAFGKPWIPNSNSYVSSAVSSNFSAASYYGCCGAYTCSVVPTA